MSDSVTHPAVVNFASDKHSVELRDVSTPDIGPDDVLLQVAAVGVCGTDLHQWTADHSWPFSQRAWYAVGHHAGRKAVRSLKLNRFTRCNLTDKPYAVPDKFSLKQHLGKAWRMIRGKESYDVVIDFAAEFAETIADTHWHATQRIDHHDDGSITFRCKVDGLDEIVWWVLSMGPHCVVKKPKELAVRVRDLAAKTVALYPPA